MENIGFIIALIIAIPVILLPAAFIWYINVSGLWEVMKDARQRKAKANRVSLPIKQEVNR